MILPEAIPDHPETDERAYEGEDGQHPREWLETGKERQPFADVPPPLTGLALSPDGRTFVTSDAAKGLRIGESDTGRELQRIAEANARCPTVSPDSVSVATTMCNLPNGAESYQFRSLSNWSPHSVASRQSFSTPGSAAFV